MARFGEFLDEVSRKRVTSDTGCGSLEATRRNDFGDAGPSTANRTGRRTAVQENEDI